MIRMKHWEYRCRPTKRKFANVTWRWSASFRPIAPERFASIRAAYEQLHDPTVRLQSLLFGVGKEDSIPAMIAEARNHLRNARIPTKTLLALARP